MVGKDFTTFLAATNNISAELLVTNKYGDNNPPEHEVNGSYIWKTTSRQSDGYLSQVSINYDDEINACKSVN